MYTLHNHEKRTVSVHSTLVEAIEAAKATWPDCLILIDGGPNIDGSTICIYEDLEDACDERAAGEITGDAA